MKKIIIKIGSILLALVLVCTLFVGCREADRANYNIKKQADNFNVTRRLSVINMRSDKPILEIIGNFSIETDVQDNQLEVTMEVSKGVYKVHYVYLNDWTMYTIEDITGANVSPYHYEINYIPETFQVFSVTSND